MNRKQTLYKAFATIMIFVGLAFGQQAMATTKTVTYTITDVQQVSSSLQVTITRSGDTPFEGGSTTYTMSVSNSSLGNGSGHYSVMLADGFQLSLHWNANNNVIFQGNYIRPAATNGKITYTVICQSYYYVTNLQMTGFEGTWYNTDYNSQWNFYQSQTSGYSLGAVTITYTDTPDISIFESDGDNVYKIKSYSDLRHLANYVNNGKNSCSGLTFRQTQNITGDNNYTPIGYHVDSNDRAYFEGTYDGQGHSVSGITVNRTGTNDRDDYYIGLFGYIYHAVVKDVVITNCTFTGYYYVGGVVGYNKQSTVSNCLVTSSVTINAGHNDAQGLGGIVGANTGDSSKILGCRSDAVVSSNGKTGCTGLGGITGYVSVNTIVRSCLYTGTIVSGGSSRVGAIIGYNNGGTPYFNNNYYTTGSMGGINGNDANGLRRARTVTLGNHVATADNPTEYNVSGLTALGMSSAPTALRTADGTLYSAVGQTMNFTHDYGTLSAGYLVVYTATGGGTFFDKQLTMPDADVTINATATDVWGVTASPASDGSEDHPYTITSPDGLTLLAKCVNGTDGYTADNGFSGTYFKLGNDIAYTYTSAWDNTSSDEINYIAIGNSSSLSFNGTLNGDGHTISGIRYKESFSNNYRGLFGNVGTGGTIKNLTLADSRISGKNYIGGIAGQNDGTIRDCIVWRTSLPELTHSGAIVGNNSGTITDNYYRDCTVGSRTSNIGCNGSDRNGARGVYTVTTSNDVTATGSPSVEVGGDICYIGNVSTITLSHDPLPTGYSYKYKFAANGFYNIVEGNTFTMPHYDTEVVAVLCRTLEVTGYGDGNGRWAFIASPSDGSCTVNEVDGLWGEQIGQQLYDYDLYQLNPGSMMWENYHQHSDEFFITNGNGYLYATHDTKTLVFPGPFVTDDSKEMTLEQGWNLVGNPFVVDAYVDRPFYKMNAEGTCIEPVIADFNDYVPTSIPACTGIVVKAETSNEKVTFSKDAPVSATGNHGYLTIALSQADTRSNSTLDKAFVSFNEGSQLGKFYFLEQDANICLPQGGEEYAIAFSEGRGEMPLNFKAHKNGEYSLTVSYRAITPNGVTYLHLVDHLTGADIDLLVTPSYTFNAKTTDYESRFKLVFNANGAEGNDDFAFIDADGNIVINGDGIVQIIDMLGHVLATRDVHSDSRLLSSDFPTGVYVLRLINGENVKTQKIVIQ